MRKRAKNRQTRCSSLKSPISILSLKMAFPDQKNCQLVKWGMEPHGTRSTLIFVGETVGFRELADLFDEMDEDGGGTLTKDEFKRAIRKLGLDIDASQTLFLDFGF